MRNIIKVFGLSILSSVALLGATPIINSGNIEKQIQAPRDIPTLKKDDIKIEGIENDSLKSSDRDRKSTRLNSSHLKLSRMPSSA